MTQYFTVGLILISTGFLGDALRRFKKQSTEHENLVLNTRLMYLHITVVTLQVLVSFVIWTILAIVARLNKRVLFSTVETI